MLGFGSISQWAISYYAYDQVPVQPIMTGTVTFHYLKRSKTKIVHFA